MAKLCDYSKYNNKIQSVTFQMTTPSEAAIYQKLLESEGLLQCPHCSTKLDRAGEVGMFITVVNPTSANSLGFATGNPYTVCSKCGEKLNLSMIDISPFAEVASFISQLKYMDERKGKVRESEAGKE